MSSTEQKSKNRQNALMAVLAFFMPAIVLLACFAVSGIVPFGSTIPASEAASGWFADAAHLSGLLKDGNGSLFYTFKNGFGSDFYLRFSSGLCSPFVLIFSMFGEGEIYTAYMLIMLVRAAFAGLFCYLMLYPMEQSGAMAALAVSVGYASGSVLCLGLSAPGVTDAAVILPLVGAGIASLIDRGGVVLLYAALTLFFVCSTTLWPCCVLFAVVFFLWRTIMYQERGRWLAQFALMLMCFALAAGSAAIIGIPLFSTGVELGSVVTSYESADSVGVFRAVSGMFTGGASDGGAAALFCSVLTVLMIPVYLFNSRFTAGERAVGMASLVLSFAMLATPANWLMTIFASPTGTVAASGIVYCALAAAMAVRGFSRPSGIRVPIVVLGWTLAVLCFVSALLFSGDTYSVTATVFTFTFITLYAALIILAGSRKRMTVAFSALLALCVAGECAFGLVGEISAIKNSTGLYNEQYIESEERRQQSLHGIIDSSEYNLQSGEFFRIRGAQSDSLNVLTSKSEGESPVCSQLLEVLGVRDTEGFTPLTDALFSVRYTVGGENIYSTVGNIDGVPVRRNQSALPLAYVASQDVLALTSYSENPFEAQNQLLSAISGAQRNVFNQAAVYSRAGNGTSLLEMDGATEVTRYDDYGTVDYIVSVPVDGRMYMWYGCPYDGEETVYVNGAAVAVSPMNRIVPLGYFGAGEMINVSVTVSAERFILGNVYFSALDVALLDASLAQLSAKQVSFTQNSDGTIKLGAALEPGQIIMTTIPYQSGWKVTDASGKTLERECAAGAFLAVSPGEGSAAVELSYKSNDFTLSMAASILFVLLSIVMTVVIEYRRNAAGVRPRVAYDEQEEDIQPPPDYFPGIEPIEYGPADMVYPQKYVSTPRPQPIYEPLPLQNIDPMMVPLVDQIPDEPMIMPLPPLPTQTDLPHPPAPMDPSVFDKLVGPGADFYQDQ